MATIYLIQSLAWIKFILQKKIETFDLNFAVILISSSKSNYLYMKSHILVALMTDFSVTVSLSPGFDTYIFYFYKKLLLVIGDFP